MKRAAVFLDRDGVLNISQVVAGKPYAPRTLQDFVLFDGVGDDLQELKNDGFLLIVVTNQPDVGNGFVSQEVVESMHERLLESVPLDDIEACFASQKEGSYRRKPEPGMILDAAAKWNADLSQSFVVGDRWSDIEAGRKAGCKTIFIDRGYEEKRPENPDFVVKNLREGVKKIIKQKRVSQLTNV